MALAPYFSKAALGSTALMQGVSIEEFVRLVRTLEVTIRFGADAAESPEGKISLEMLTNLLSRFYPTLCFDAIGNQAVRFAEELGKLAKQINPDIEFSTPKPPYVVVGNPAVGSSGFSVFIGSDGWNASFSTRAPREVGQSQNPFGAGASGCFGAAGIFRYFFHQQLGVPEPAEEFVLSLFNYSRVPCELNEPVNYDLGEIALAGVGAIGNATAWLLAKSDCEGSVHLVDPETLDTTNPQRYILADAASADTDKVSLAARELGASKLTPLQHKTTWGGFIANRPNWEVALVAVALDSWEDRIAVQASLPKWILNSWTQANDLGVSRHRFGSSSACLACMYWPRTQKRNLDEIIKDAIRYSGDLMDIRNMLYFQTVLDESWLDRISGDMGQPRELLEPFKGKPIDAFYREAICGGHVIAAESGNIEVPMAFQSAMAGVMLASEIVQYGKRGRELQIEQVTTKIDLLRPLGTRLSEQYKKRTDVSCICSDAGYCERYYEKYREDRY